MKEGHMLRSTCRNLQPNHHSASCSRFLKTIMYFSKPSKAFEKKFPVGSYKPILFCFVKALPTDFFQRQQYREGG